MLYNGTSYIVLIMLRCSRRRSWIYPTNTIFLKKADSILGSAQNDWTMSCFWTFVIYTPHRATILRSWNSVWAPFWRSLPPRFCQIGGLQINHLPQFTCPISAWEKWWEKAEKKRQGQGSFSLGASENGRNESDKIRSLLALDIF